VVGEIFPNAIRGKAMALATLIVMGGQLFSWPVNTGYAGGLGSSWTFWLFALCCSPALWITWKLIPETKGRSLENIENYWKETYHKARHKREEQCQTAMRTA
jgi:SP family arabinose:H+ symporter-like MFS transporter